MAAGVVFPACAGESFDLDGCFERVLVDIGDQKKVSVERGFKAESPEGSWNHAAWQYLGHKEMVKQTVWLNQSEDEIPRISVDLPSRCSSINRLTVCPSTARRKELGRE